MAKTKQVNKKTNNKQSVDTKKAKVKTPKEKYEAKKAKKKRKKFMNGRFSLDILDLLIVIVATAIVSCLLTGLILNKQYRSSGILLDSSLSEDKALQEFIASYEEIVNHYYEQVDREGMLDAATKGMLNFLGDNYSIFLTDDAAESLTESLDGTYNGLGIVEIGNVVYDVYKDSPADEVGIKAGDEIISVNGHEINVKNYLTISDYLKDNEENEVIVKRDGKEVTFKIKTGIVVIPSVSSTIVKSKDATRNIGYIELYTFSKLSFEEFRDELLKLEEEYKISSLIIDLRNNNGGYVASASNIASMFLKKGDVIYSMENQKEVRLIKDETDEKREFEIVILVNSRTASAAEILTAALHDSYGAKVVGVQTYGKGKVQNVKSSSGKVIKYTTARWLRPNGECVDEVGITPDYKVDIEYKNGVIYDKQYDKALELLR